MYPQRPEENDFRSPAASFTFTRFASATFTADFGQSDSKLLSYLDVISSIAQIPDKPDPNEGAVSDEPLAQAHRIQQAYREWCDFYDKIWSKERLGIFSSNFLAVEEFHAKTGRPLVMNQFADMTEEEYVGGNQQSATHDDDPTTISSSSTEEEVVEDRISVAYKEWCEYYGRAWDENRLSTFTSNFIAVEKYHQHTKKPLVLNEFADMTEREYEEYLGTVAQPIVAPEPEPEPEPEPIGSMGEAHNHSFSSPTEPIAAAVSPDPDPYPTDVPPQAVEPPQQPSAPSSPTLVIQSKSEITDDYPEDTPDASSSLSASADEVLSTLQDTVASLTTMVYNMASATQVVPPPQSQAQPLDSLVIDVLQQQDESIHQLEMSIDGIHEIQMQSSDLIELVSNNQRQMTEMMESVQSEITVLQEERRITNENYARLLARIEELEAAVRKHDISDPSLNKALVLARATATRGKQLVEIKPNIPAIGANPMFTPVNLDSPQQQ